jgi:hypothetical protein
MYAYLKSESVAVMSDKGSVGKGQTGNKNFNIKDPDGHIVEILEYQPDSWTGREHGKFMPGTRISDHIMHVGVQAETSTSPWNSTAAFSGSKNSGGAAGLRRC